MHVCTKLKNVSHLYPEQRLPVIFLEGQTLVTIWKIHEQVLLSQCNTGWERSGRLVRPMVD